MSLALSFRRLWAPQAPFGSRSASTRLFKPKPRSMRRRTYEKVIQPVLPKESLTLAERCRARHEAEIKEMQKIPSALVQAEVAEFVKWFSEQGLVAICHTTACDPRTRRLDTGEMKVAGVELREWNEKVRVELLRRTRLSLLRPLVALPNSAFLLATDIQQFKTVVNFAKRFPWITILAFVIDDRILSVEEVDKLWRLPSLDAIPAQTVSILGSVPLRTSHLLQSMSLRLLGLLSSFENRLKCQ